MQTDCLAAMPKIAPVFYRNKSRNPRAPSLRNGRLIQELNFYHLHNNVQL